jgi:predicted RNA-binding Zn ribbon-like protein
MAKDYSAPGELELVRLFVNTFDPDHPERDPLLSRESTREWLAGHGFPADGGLDDGEKAAMQALREALLADLRAHTGDGNAARAWDRLATHLSGTGLDLVFGEGEHVRLEPRIRRGYEGLRGAIASRVYNAVKSGQWRRLKVCRRETCLFAFYDKSKNGSGTWCDMAACGNRAKAQRRRSRERTSGSKK